MQANAHPTARAHCDGAPVHYARHRPEQTTLCRQVQQHAATFFVQAEDAAGASVFSLRVAPQLPLALAFAHAQQLASAQARVRAIDAGAASVRVGLSRWDNQVVNDFDGNMFFESRVTATASGPALTLTDIRQRTLAQENARPLRQQDAHAAVDLCLSCDGQPCLSACPVGTGYRYGKPHAAFHMAAFAGRH